MGNGHWLYSLHAAGTGKVLYQAQMSLLLKLTTTQKGPVLIFHREMESWGGQGLCGHKLLSRRPPPAVTRFNPCLPTVSLHLGFFWFISLLLQLLKQDGTQEASKSWAQLWRGLNVILTVFDSGLRLLSIIEEGIAWERKGKRDSQTTIPGAGRMRREDLGGRKVILPSKGHLETTRPL